MNMHRRQALLGSSATLGLAALGGLYGCATLREPTPLPRAEWPPAAPREWRAAWVASVAHIDWPPRPGLAVAEQQASALAMVERARQIGLNALILQVRPAGDALYASKLEPWSEYLTGEQGRAPDPAWDPLAFWAEACERQGLELHAWLNPFRARHPSARTPLVAPHLGVSDPVAVKSYGDLQWMDPAEPAAAQRTLAVALDIVRRYPVAGLHIDDYFYPYPVRQGEVEQPFPDQAAWHRYLREARQSGALPREDWRREQVDRLVRELHRSLRQLRPEMAFGISPFGLGRPDRRPAGVSGFSQYDKLYADVEHWLAEGWMDYLAPQLYWPIDSSGQPFGVLLDYWLAQNPRGLPVRPGLFSSRVGAAERPWPAREIIDQISLLRGRTGVDGHVHFSLSALLQDRDGLAQALLAGPYAQPALPPRRPGPRLRTAPSAPQLRLRWPGSLELEPLPGVQASVHALWWREAGRWRFAVQPAAQPALALPAQADALVVSAVDAYGQEGAREGWRIR